MVRKTTAKDIAEALGISTMTVSRALNNKTNVSASTRQKVIETSRRLGYFPNHIAKSLVLKKDRNYRCYCTGNYPFFLPGSSQRN